MVDRSERFFTFARVFDDVWRFEQAGDNGDAAGAGSDHFLEIVDLNSTDAEDWRRNIGMDAFDVGQSDRFVVWFGRGRENRSETNVIGVFVLRSNGLLKAVR